MTRWRVRLSFDCSRYASSLFCNLRKGDRVRLTWLPDRTCDILYEGSLSFRVTNSSYTRLQTGDTFHCSLIIEGEPLYLDNLQQQEQPPVVYVCGKKSGVYYELLPSAHSENPTY